MISTVCISITFRDLKTETRFEDSALPFASAATAAKSLRHEAWNTWQKRGTTGLGGPVSARWILPMLIINRIRIY